MRENPAWATHAIADSYVFLENRVPPQWLPKLTKAAPAPRGKMVATMKEYGCGAYGCVLPTLDSTTVLKVTTDQSEADFASGLAAELVADIVVAYRMVVSLAARHDGRPIWLLWRESAEHVGGLIEVLGKRAGEAAERAVHEQHEEAQKIVAHLAKYPTRAPRLVSYKDSLHRMREIPELAKLARGMIDVLEQQHVLIGDVHGGNLGVVDGQWKIIDPGHVIVIGETQVTANPSKEGVGRWKAPDIFGKSLNARMLRMLWEKGSMSQAEFMRRYHNVGGELEGERRSTRLTEGKTAFLNNLGRYVRGHAALPGDYMPSQEGIEVTRVREMGGRAQQPVIATADHEAHKRAAAIREQASRYLQPIERRIDGRPIDSVRYGRRIAIDRSRWEGSGDRSTVLFWVGPTHEEWLRSLSDDELEKSFASMETVALASGDALDATWMGRLGDEMKRRGLGVVDVRRRNPAKPIDEAVTTATRLLMDRSPNAMTVLEDMVQERGDTMEEFLFELSAGKGVQIREMPTDVDDYAHGEFPPLAPPFAEHTGRWGLLEKVAIQWELRGWQRHSRSGLWWSPRLTIIAPLTTNPKDKSGTWEMPLWLALHMPGKSWVVHPKETIRLDYPTAKRQLMAACWTAINILRPEEWPNYNTNYAGEPDPKHGTANARVFVDAFVDLFR